MKITHTEDYRQLRRAAYPSLEEFADAMYWHSRGDPTKLDAYHARIDAIKASIPKPKLGKG